jgi:Rho GTPase-activating protein 1
LFRRSPSSALLKQVCDAYDRGDQPSTSTTFSFYLYRFLGHVVSLETFGDPHLAAVLIKKYLRDLPEPIFPESLYTLIGLCPVPSNEPGDISTVTYIREVLLPELPRCSYILINSVLRMAVPTRSTTFILTSLRYHARSFPARGCK